MRFQVQLFVAVLAAMLTLPSLHAAKSGTDDESSAMRDEGAAAATVASDDESAEASDETSAEPGQRTEIREEIIVTGKLIQETLKDTPESVGVWGSDALTDAGMRELLDVYNQTANAYQIANGEGFGIRGINHNSVGTGGAGELGSYYVDGVALTGFSKRYGPMQLWDVEQIEILRGPQTTNVGRNALAGAVVMNTKEPVFQSENAWRLGIGDESTWEAAGMVNFSTGSSSALRITAETWNTDGFVSNPTRGEDDFDARENLTLRGKWLLEPQGANNPRFLFSVQYGETQRGNDAVDLSRPDDRVNLSNLDDFEENDSLVLSLDFSLGLSDDWRLRSITSYLDSEYRRFDDDDQGPGGGSSFRGRTAVDRNWAQDLRLEYARGGVRGVSGLYYTEVDLDNDTRGETALAAADLGIPAALLPLYPATIVVAGDLPAVFETTNFAAFTHWNWELNERWSAFAGFRWDREEQTSDQSSITSLITELPNPAELPPALAGPVALINGFIESQLGTSFTSTETDYEAFLPEVGISRRWNDTVTSSLFYKRGYRAGGAELSLVGRQNEYDPEFLDLFELSLRATPGRLAVNGNVYFGSWKDQQVNVQQSDSAFDFLTENAGESEIYGFELDTSYRGLGSWDLYGSLGFAHTEFTSFDSATQGDLSGNRFAGAPEWTAALGASYRFGGGWFAHGDVNYQGEAFASVDNELTLDERTVLNLRAGYETGRYTIYVYLNNVTDETYAVTAFRNVDGRLIGKLGFPRHGGVQLSLRF